MHIGNLRTAFYAYALAKHNKGDFILRIEDTDKKREVGGGIEEIKSLLTKFDIKWDEFYIQSERLELYKEAAKKLIEEGHAFYCQCEGKNAKEEWFSTKLRDECRDKGFTSGAIKLKVPDGEAISFRDFVLKEEVVWQTEVVFDATLLKSDGYPTYHLAVVVDDNEMNITHVLRGHDWLPSTPIHLLVYKYLGFKLPEIGHLTDILDPEGGKLSKRRSSTSVEVLLAEGFLPEAIFNFVILVGWAPKDNREIFTLSEFVEVFDENGFQKSNPVFNKEKLLWMNGEYIREVIADEELVKRIEEYNEGKYKKGLIKKILPLVKTRMKSLKEFDEMANFFVDEPKVDMSLFSENAEECIASAVLVLSDIEWKIEAINEELMKEIEKKGFKVGEFFMALRFAVSGQRITPPINESLVILGKSEVLKRLKKILSHANKNKER